MSNFGKIVIALIVTALIACGVFYIMNKRIAPVEIPESIATSTLQQEIIGVSVQGRNIEAFTYGSGEKHIVFVGGIHGGYEWNSVLLAYQFMDYLKAYPEFILSNLKITIIPSANPDGLYKVIKKEGRFIPADVPTDKGVLSAGRFNANDVDLNRNFACKWQSTATWRNNAVSPGTEAFSEPETKAIRDFTLRYNPDAFVFWHSQANAVYASECERGILPDTLTIMNTYSKASGYKAVESFDAYPVVGDAEGWLASINIPAITVELSTHETIEWEKNLLGIKALFDHYK